MWLIRAFEESVSELVGTGEVVGLVHVSIGQEASAVGVCDVLEARDRVYSGHRAHGHVLARGAEPAAVMAELMGKAAGLCGGKGGSMHLVDVAHGVLEATGVVGGTIPLALGTALALRETEPGAVAVVFFGDGAVQTGYFHESLNIAALWKLPVLLVCENNGYAEFTPRSAHTPVERVTRHAETYGVDARTVDGNDVVAIREAASALVAPLRSGGGPALLECLTYRMRGHYEGDPAKYREASEVAEWKAKDPVRRFASGAVATGELSAEDAAACEAAARRAVAAAVAAARSAPFPAASALTEDVGG
ncbi:MAG: thiamine pyrophosphate-dependent dehydrogenase E1 component subunit alpha [Chloroflexota bacterium]|nr:thiamine pyrophosphate-dependent dehydrogenase E1 component subunit alpha [Chloroflexota bacterium]MDE3102758.1 thiamine pyrophosphate-dependent dehydrogenase E1 component subunit alpha [Chloroflexota bacterium]